MSLRFAIWNYNEPLELDADIFFRECNKVTMLSKEKLQPLISIALLIEMRLRDTYGLNWEYIKTNLYVLPCVKFPSCYSTSCDASFKGQSPYLIPDEDIWEFFRDEDMIILQDLNARTPCYQILFLWYLIQQKHQAWVFWISLRDGATYALAILNVLGRYPLVVALLDFHRGMLAWLKRISLRPLCPLALSVTHCLLLSVDVRVTYESRFQGGMAIHEGSQSISICHIPGYMGDFQYACALRHYLGSMLMISLIILREEEIEVFSWQVLGYVFCYMQIILCW